jgi:chaperone modulatory protein CbpM
MSDSRTNQLRGILLDEQVTFTLHELCDACGVRRQLIVEMVEEGVIEPAPEAESEWQFHGHALVRAQRALRLVRDLDLNWAGAALALDLLDEIDRLKRGSL